MKHDLDLIDKKLLVELDKNARVSAAALSRRLRLPKETVNYRIKRLFASGHIQYAYTLVNAARLAHTHYKVFLKFRPLSRTTLDAIITYIRRQQSCANLRVLDGEYDLVFLTVHESPESLQRFFTSFQQLFGAELLVRSVHLVTASHTFSSVVAGLQEGRTLLHGEPSSVRIDALDRALLSAISRDARARLVDLARLLGEPPQTTRYRLRRLEREGVIAGYAVALDRDKFRRVFVQVDVLLKTSARLSSIIEFFGRSGTCLFAYELLGRYDLSFELSVEGEREFRRLLDEFTGLFLDEVLVCETSRIIKDFTVNWSPFDAALP